MFMFFYLSTYQVEVTKTLTVKSLIKLRVYSLSSEMERRGN